MDPKIRRQILDLLRAGNYIKTAADAVGLSTETIHGWMREGAKELRRREAGEPPDHTMDLLVSFTLEARAALSHAEATAVGKLTRSKDWRAQVAYLERRFPKRWGTKIQLHVKQELDAFLDKLEKSLDQETFKQVLNAALADVDRSEDGGDTAAGSEDEETA